jgi:hypothetical protein
VDDFPPPLPLDPMPERTVEPGPIVEPPIVEVTPDPLIAPLDVYPDVLAYTGGEWVLVAAVACALLAIGFAFLAAASWSRPRYRRGRAHTRSVRGSAGFTP